MVCIKTTAIWRKIFFFNTNTLLPLQLSWKRCSIKLLLTNFLFEAPIAFMCVKASLLQLTCSLFRHSADTFFQHEITRKEQSVPTMCVKMFWLVSKESNFKLSTWMHCHFLASHRWPRVKLTFPSILRKPWPSSPQCSCRNPVCCYQHFSRWYWKSQNKRSKSNQTAKMRSEQKISRFKFNLH